MTNKTKFSLLVAFILIIAVTYGFLSGDETPQPVVEKSQETTKASMTQQEKENKYPQAPEFALKDLEGNEVKLSDYRGKVVVLDFWATWCPPCRKGIPDFVEMQKNYGEDNFVVLGINMDQGKQSEVIPLVSEFAKNYKINYPVLLFNQEVIYDKEGKVRQGVRGYRPMTFFTGIIDPLR